MKATYRTPLSVVIPLYNEQDSVHALVKRLEEALLTAFEHFEVILVDDGSQDETVERTQILIDQSPMDIKLVALQRNFGQTAAMQAGIDQAQGELIATLDGDLQNDPIDIPMMVKELKDKDLDLLVGWRKKRKDGLFLRKIPSKIANRLIGKITGVQLHDYGCSLKIYRSKVIKQVKLLGEMHRFIPAWTAVVTSSKRIGEIPVSHHARQFGESKYGISRTFRVLIDLLSVMFFMRYRNRPGHFFGSIGLLLGAVGGLMLAYLGFDKFILGHDIGTRPMLLIGVLFIMGAIQMLSTGIIAEILTRSHHATSDQKQSYVIGAIHSKDQGDPVANSADTHSSSANKDNT